VTDYILTPRPTRRPVPTSSGSELRVSAPMPARSIQFFAAGTPKGQPRARAFAKKMGGKFVARMYDAGTAEEWKTLIVLAANPHLPKSPIAGAIRVDLTFYFPRPKGHFRSNGELKPNAPTWHTSKPDRDNAEKAVTDCLTQVGVFADDALICAGEVQKLYTPEGMRAGVLVKITPLEGN